MDKEQEFREHLIEMFKTEAQEHLKSISINLIELEKAELADEQKALLEVVLRESHSLKGASRAVDEKEIEVLCQTMETIFSAMKRGELALLVEHYDVLQKAVDFLGKLALTSGEEHSQEEKEIKSQLFKSLEGISKGARPQDRNSVEEPPSEELSSEAFPAKEKGFEIEKANEADLGRVNRTKGDDHYISSDNRSTVNDISDNVRVSATRLSSVLLQSEEMLSSKLSASQRAVDLKKFGTKYRAWEKEWMKILTDVHNITPKDEPDYRNRSLSKVLDFIQWNCTFMKSMGDEYKTIAKSAERDSLMLNGMVENLLDEMKKVMMFPFSSILEMMPKVVRDISRENGLEVELFIKGGEIEIDRRILNEMKDPFIHLMRNWFLVSNWKVKQLSPYI